MPPSSPNRGPHASYVTKGQKWSERQGCRYEAVVSNDVCKCDFIGEPWALLRPNEQVFDGSGGCVKGTRALNLEVLSCAVRSAFKAGVSPSRIVRHFGLSQSDVRKALASDAK